MSLRNRLIYLLTAFAVFAVVASFATIYGVQLHVDDAIADFQQSMAQTGQVDHLRVAARDQLAQLRDVLEGRREPNEAYQADRHAFFVRLEEVTRYAPAYAAASDRDDLLHLVERLRDESDRCLALVSGGRADDARQVLNREIEGDLLEALDSRLQTARSRLDDSRDLSVNDLVATNTQVLILAAAVGAFGAGLVVVGTALIRRWLMVPIRDLRNAVEAIGAGNLDARVAYTANDELGALGDTLNRMAASLVKAQADLHVSESKYRSLFRNLRDAVVICDAEGRVVEYHDSDTQLLVRHAAEDRGRHLLDVWPHWRSGSIDWASVIERVMRSGEQFRAVSVTLRRGNAQDGPDARPAGDDDEVFVDLVAYPVEYAEARYVAIVLRDVTSRQYLESQARRTEAMEASMTLARGIAHDFTNLLTSATGTLALLEPTVSHPEHLKRIRTASRACWQAAGLASRLLNFASGSEGHPQVFCLSEMVKLLLGSLDETVFGGVRVHCEHDRSVLVKMDRDQLTQVVLNLVRNACEAMPNGGDLRIAVKATTARDVVTHRSAARYALLTVADTGCGMTPEVEQRIFEPFFTTKKRTARRGRGMGLAVVYAAVKNAGGFIRVDSQVGAGTVFEVYLPFGQGVPEPVEPGVPALLPELGTGTILLVEDNPAILQTCTEAFEKCGYVVIGAESVSDAQRKFRSARNGGVDLAVIDMSLPDGDGVGLAEDLLAAKPDLRLIFITGFAEMVVPRSLQPRVCARLLKPFRVDTLAKTVSDALSSQ